MGWKCAPQVMGLVRGEPKQGQKHRANIRKIAMEAGYERASKSDTLDKSRSSKNHYDGCSSGAEFAAVMEQEASKYRVKVNGKTKDKKPVVREKGLPHNAVIGWAVIYNPPAEVCAAWTNEDYQKFYADCRECMAKIEPRLFRSENIRMSAEHFDEGIPPDENSGVVDRHLHDLGVSKDADGRYCGNLIDAKLLIKINERFPALMRECGWDMDDLDRTDFERAKTDKEYASERNAKRRQSGLSVNKHLGKKAREMAEDAAELVEQAESLKAQMEADAAALKAQVEADAAARQQQLDLTAQQQETTRKEQEALTQQQEDTQKKLDGRDKGQRRLLKFIYNLYQNLSGERAAFRTYSEGVEMFKTAMDSFVERTTTEARTKAQEEAATAFQKKEDALEAQKSVLDELEQLRDKLQSSTDTDTSRKHFMEAHTFRDGRTLEDAYQASIRQKQERDTAFMNRASELRNEYDRLHQGVEQQEKQ